MLTFLQKYINSGVVAPALSFAIDWSNPLSQGLILLHCPTALGASAVVFVPDSVTEELWTGIGGTIGIQPASNGLGLTGSYDGTRGSQIAGRLWPQSGFTVVQWVNPTSTTTQILSSAYTGGTSAYFQFAILTGGQLFCRIQQNIDVDYIQRNGTAGDVAANQWQHVAMTWNGGTTDSAIRGFVNGVRRDTTNAGAGTFTGPYSGTGQPLYLGCQNVASAVSTGLTGFIGMSYIYNRCLTQAEIIGLYQDPWAVFQPYEAISSMALTGSAPFTWLQMDEESVAVPKSRFVRDMIAHD